MAGGLTSRLGTVPRVSGAKKWELSMLNISCIRASHLLEAHVSTGQLSEKWRGEVRVQRYVTSSTRFIIVTILILNFIDLSGLVLSTVLVHIPKLLVLQ
jgi:hypothetical protein